VKYEMAANLKTTKALGIARISPYANRGHGPREGPLGRPLNCPAGNPQTASRIISLPAPPYRLVRSQPHRPRSHQKFRPP
jgi:hypothetical protein